MYLIFPRFIPEVSFLLSLFSQLYSLVYPFKTHPFKSHGIYLGGGS